MVTNDTKTTQDEEPGQAEVFVRSFIAGHPQGSVRRIVLYTVTTLVLLVAAIVATNPIIEVACALGTASLLLLAMSDQLA